jgi:hypothetical protein
MFNHSFILSPGLWTGEGKIALNMVEEELAFKTSWSLQNIQIQGLSEHMQNELTFSDFQPKTFVVEMENQNVGRIVGSGVYDDKMIGWEFRNPDISFEGFETYHLQADGSYLMKGEYITSDQFRTQIEARIVLQSKEVPKPDESQESEE